MKSTNSNSQKERGYPQFTKQVRRTFSEELKIKKVKLYDQGIVGVSELSRQLEVSRSAIYKWIYKYSLIYVSPINVVMESKSEAKKVDLIKKELQSTYEALGRKQTHIDFLTELLEIASDHYGEDITKKFLPDTSTPMGKSEGEEN